MTLRSFQLSEFIMRFLLFITLLFFLSCQKGRDNSQQKILHYPLSNEVSTIDTALSYDTVSANIVYQVYETLFEYEYLKRPYTLKPLLAEKMPQIENSGLKYTIKIRRGIKFHNLDSKVELVAEDFITQIKRIALKSTKSGGWWLFEDKIKGLNEFRKTNFKSLKQALDAKISGLYTKDKYTLVIELNKPYPQLQYALAMSFTAPLPKDMVIKHNNDLSNVEYGTGPFILKRWNKGLELVLEKFPYYHKENYPRLGDRYANEKNLLSYAGKELPFLDKIHFHVMKESQTRWLNFLSGKIDLLILDKDNYKTATNSIGELNADLKEKQIDLQISPTLTYWWLAFNMKDKIVGSNINLRKAIAHAINVDDYISVFTNNVGQKANSIYPPGIPGYNPSNQLPYQYNIEKAKAYLKLAGYPNGKGLPELTYDVRGNSTTNRQMGEYIQKELARIGIKVNIQVNTFPSFLNKLKNGELQFWLGGWALDYPDAENIIQLLFSKNLPPGPNATSFENKTVDRLFKEISLMNDNALKFEKMEEVEKIIHDNLPWVMLYYSRNYIIHHNRVKNYRFSDLIYNNLKYIDI